MSVGVVTHHPRFTFLVLSILLVCFYILLPEQRPRPTQTTEYLQPSKSLSRVLREEDVLYGKTLEAREALVKKWGPTEEQVVMFPVKGDFYTLWDFFIPTFRCPHRVSRVGTLGDGGKWVCGLERIARQRTPCTIYSFGVNGESSFEAALLAAAPHCRIWGYDFSVTSFGPEITDADDPALRARAQFYPYALGSEDKPYHDPPTYTLQSLMRQNGHTFIDVLKIDIEGAEFESLASFINAFVPAQGERGGAGHPHVPYSKGEVLPIGQLQIEIHARGENGESFAKFRQWWENLEHAGLRPFWTEPNLVYVNLVRGVRPDLSEYSFINIRGRHALTDDHY